ncbi:MAG: hypothetical protein K8W52_33765 [Deltaproteobacteria bacterium]|nr:hypothetical protein [Deltaproteobacteria bacterium]
MASFVFIVGCGASSHHSSTPAAFAHGAPYAQLFESGAAWTYEVATLVRFAEADLAAENHEQPETRGTIEVRCSVTEVRELIGGVASQIACDGDPEAVGREPIIAGVWIASAAGVWRGDELPAAGSAVPTGDALLPPTPVAKHEAHQGEDDDGATSFDVAQKDGAWCETFVDASDYSLAETRCFDGGIASAHVEATGEPYRELTYTRK